jgi:hypothetical protein
MTPPRADARMVCHRARRIKTKTEKSFLLLFFKKEALSFA